MTATVVVPTTSAPATLRAAATPGPRELSAGTDLFDRQLHVARQQHEPAHPPTDATSRKSAQSPSHESGGKSMRERADASTSKSIRASKNQPAADPLHAASTDAGSTATTPSAAPSSLTSQLAAAATVANNDPVDPGSDDEADGDQAGSALAGSMLVLLGLSAGVAFGSHPAADGDATASAGTHAGAGKTATADAGNATWLQANGVDGGIAAAATATMPVTAGMLPAAADAKSTVIDKTATASSDLTSVLAMSAPLTTAAPVIAHQLQLPPSVGSQAFAHELGQQVVWLAGQDVKQARIRLHPDDLGQLDVKISVTHDRVDVVFSAQHPAAVTAVQQSLSQLGQMLTQQGLSLGHAEVGQHDRGANQGHGGGTPIDAAVDDSDEIHGAGLRASIGAVGLLDAFA